MHDLLRTLVIAVIEKIGTIVIIYSGLVKRPTDGKLGWIQKHLLYTLKVVKTSLEKIDCRQAFMSKNYTRTF